MIILKDKNSLLYETDNQELINIANAFYKSWQYEISLGNWLDWLDLSSEEFPKVVENNYYLKNFLKFSRLSKTNTMFFLVDVRADLERARKKNT